MNKLLDMIDKIYDIDNIVLRSFCKSCLCLLEIILALSIVGIIAGVLIIGEHLSLLSNIVLIIVLILIVFTIMYCILDMLER